MKDERELILCENCRTLKVQFIKTYNFCQICYRNLLEEYSFYDYKDKNKRLRGNAKRICEMLIEEGVDRLEIHKILKLNRVYVQQVINKYTNRVNKDGKVRPF